MSAFQIQPLRLHLVSSKLRHCGKRPCLCGLCHAAVDDSHWRSNLMQQLILKSKSSLGPSRLSSWPLANTSSPRTRNCHDTGAYQPYTSSHLLMFHLLQTELLAEGWRMGSGYCDSFDTGQSQAIVQPSEPRYISFQALLRHEEC